jgi:hypothetical protein
MRLQAKGRTLDFVCAPAAWALDRSHNGWVWAWMGIAIDSVLSDDLQLWDGWGICRGMRVVGSLG